MLKKYFLLVILLICASTHSFAQLISDNQNIYDLGSSVNLSSPYHTTLSFFYNLEEGHYKPENAAKTLDLSDIENQNGQRLAVKLKQIFEGKGILIRINDIPNTTIR